MKAVLDLTKAIKDRDFYDKQFVGAGIEKNILFVSPQLTSKHLYKFILPFFSFYNEDIHPAITDLSRFNPFEQIVNLSTTLSSTEILWANFIVFPFTTQDLSKPYGLYEAIREVNPMAKIVFCVDLNYYEVPKSHPYKELFDNTHMMEQVEKNILHADLILTTNIQLHDYLIYKFTALVQDKYKHIITKVNFGCVPYLIDAQIVFQNIEFESQKPEPIINKDIFIKVASVAEELKKEDLKINKVKAVKISNKAATPKKSTAKTTKVKGKKRGPKSKEEKEAIENNENKILIEEPVATTQNTETEQKQPETNTPEVSQIIQLPKKYRIGIICSPSNHVDIKDFNEQFKLINDKFGEQVSLIFIGYDYESDKNKILEGINFEYVKPISIIHYFKQILSLELDLVIVPIQKNNFNITSENTNKYLECSLLKIPLLVHDIFPYNWIITDKRNGFLHKEKADFIIELEHILKNPDLIKIVGEQSRVDCINNYTYTQKNIDLMSRVYQL